MKPALSKSTWMPTNQKSTPTTNTVAYTNQRYPRQQGPQQGGGQGRQQQGGHTSHQGGHGGGDGGKHKHRRSKSFRKKAGGRGKDKGDEAGGSKQPQPNQNLGEGKRQFRSNGRPFKGRQHKRARFNSMNECSPSETCTDSEDIPNPPKLNATRSSHAGRKAPAGYAFVQGTDTLIPLPK